MRACATALVPRFPAARKGAHGKVLVIGGSDVYVGAPLYASMAALRTGATGGPWIFVSAPRLGAGGGAFFGGPSDAIVLSGSYYYNY